MQHGAVSPTSVSTSPPVHLEVPTAGGINSTGASASATAAGPLALELKLPPLYGSFTDQDVLLALRASGSPRTRLTTHRPESKTQSDDESGDDDEGDAPEPDQWVRPVIKNEVSSFNSRLSVTPRHDGPFGLSTQLLEASRPLLAAYMLRTWDLHVHCGRMQADPIAKFVEEAMNAPGEELRHVYFAGGDDEPEADGVGVMRHASLIFYLRETIEGHRRNAVFFVDSVGASRFEALRSAMAAVSAGRSDLQVYEQVGVLQNDMHSCRAFSWEAAATLGGKNPADRTWRIPNLIADLERRKIGEAIAGVQQVRPRPEISRLAQREEWIPRHASNELDHRLLDSVKGKTLRHSMDKYRFYHALLRTTVPDYLRQKGEKLRIIAEVEAIREALEAQPGTEWNDAQREAFSSEMLAIAKRSRPSALDPLKSAQDNVKALFNASDSLTLTQDVLAFLNLCLLEVDPRRRASYSDEAYWIKLADTLAVYEGLQELKDYLRGTHWGKLDSAINHHIRAVQYMQRIETARRETQAAGDHQLFHVANLAFDPDRFLPAAQTLFETWKSQSPPLPDPAEIANLSEEERSQSASQWRAIHSKATALVNLFPSDPAVCTKPTLELLDAIWNFIGQLEDALAPPDVE